MPRDLFTGEEIPSPKDLLADAPPQEEPPRLGDDMVSKLGAGGELGLSMLSNMISYPASGLAGIAAGLIPGGKTGAEMVEAVQEAGTYQPRSRLAQEWGGNVAETLDPVFGAPARWGQSAGDAVLGATGSPLLATAAQTVIEGAPDLIGGGTTLGVRRAARLSPKNAPAPDTDTLFRLGGEAGDRMRSAGVSIREDKLAELAGDIRTTLSDEFLDPQIHPKATAVIGQISDRIENAGPGGVDFNEVYNMRRLASRQIGRAEPEDARLLGIIDDKIDDFMETLGSDQVYGGDVGSAVEGMGEMRNLWRRARNAEELEELLRRAEITAGANYTQSGLENALRKEFSRVTKNKKQFRKYPAELQAQMSAAAAGGPMDNILRGIGKWSIRGVGSGAASVGIGSLVGMGLGMNPVAGALIAPAIGEVGRKLAKRGTMNRYNRALETAQRGYLAPGMPKGNLVPASPLLVNYEDEEEY